jgi:hypothetical protein
LGYLQRGRWFLRRALKIAEEDSRGKMMIYFSLIENRHEAGDEIGTRGVTYGLLARYGLDEVIDTLKVMRHRYMSPPLDLPIISRLIGRYLQDIASNVGSLVDPVKQSSKMD